MNTCNYTVMLIFPKGDEPIKGMKPLYSLANYKPNDRYKYVPQDQFRRSFIESCRNVILMHKDTFSDLSEGYRCVITNLSFNEINKYGTPIFVCLDRVKPDKTINLTVEDIDHMNSKQLRELKYEDKKIKKARQNKQTMHQKYNQKMANKH